MDFVLVLAATVAACFALRNPIRRAPMAFNVIAAVATAACIALPVLRVPRALWVAVYVLQRKCLLPLAVFTVVMFIGVLPRASRASRWLRPIRAELSVAGWLLTLGHVTVYFTSYFPRFGALSPNVAVSLCVAMALFALLIVLGVTSFAAVKRRMSKDAWVRVQRLAYPFFLLVYVHLMLILLPSALRGAGQAAVSVVVYTTLFVAYVVLRLVRWRAEGGRQRAEEADARQAG